MISWYLRRVPKLTSKNMKLVRLTIYLGTANSILVEIINLPDFLLFMYGNIINKIILDSKFFQREILRLKIFYQK